MKKILVYILFSFSLLNSYCQTVNSGNLRGVPLFSGNAMITRSDFGFYVNSLILGAADTIKIGTGIFTQNSLTNDTVLKAGNGISINRSGTGNTITNTLPDTSIVVSTGLGITRTVNKNTLTNTKPDTGISVGIGLSISRTLNQRTIVNIKPDTGLIAGVNISITRNINGNTIGTNSNVPTGTGAANEITFWTGSNTQSGSSHYVWDNINNRVGINCIPTTSLDVADSSIKTHRGLYVIEDGNNTRSAHVNTIKIRYRNGIESSIINGDSIGAIQRYAVVGSNDTILAYTDRTVTSKVSGTKSSFEERNYITNISSGSINYENVDTTGDMLIGTNTSSNNAYLQIASNTTTKSQILLTAGSFMVSPVDNSTYNDDTLKFTDNSGVTTNYLTGYVYSNDTVQLHTIFWSGFSTTTGGVATFNITKDRTPTGISVFSRIFSEMPSASDNTATADNVPHASVKTRSLKQYIVNVTTGTGVLIGGNTSTFAPDGTVVGLTLIGR